MSITDAEAMRAVTHAVSIEHGYAGWHPWFVLRAQGQDWVGRRALAAPMKSGCAFSLVDASMLRGRLLAMSAHGGDLHVAYEVAERSACVRFFNEAEACSDTSLVFPHPCMADDGSEFVVPSTAWEPTARLVETLDAGEQHFREFAIACLRSFAGPGSLVYDPACSTGAFIASVARAFPNLRCLGSDVSAPMVALATARFSEPNLDFAVACASQPRCIAGSCDALIVRFLNAEVVTRKEAEVYFRSLATLLRRGGRMFVFGHTPVLINPEAHAAELGLRLLARVGRLPGKNALFQFYILEAT